MRGGTANPRGARAGAVLQERIRIVHAASYGTNGAPRVHAGRKAAGVAIARKGAGHHATGRACAPGPKLLARRRFGSQVQARMALFSFIEGWFNPRRRHSGLSYLSPMDFKRWMTTLVLTIMLTVLPSRTAILDRSPTRNKGLPSLRRPPDVEENQASTVHESGANSRYVCRAPKWRRKAGSRHDGFPWLKLGYPTASFASPPLRSEPSVRNDLSS